MSNYGWTNDAGEPIMSGEAWRFEQQLDYDMAAEYDFDRHYNYRDDEPDECEPGHECLDCDGPSGVWNLGVFTPNPGAHWRCAYCWQACPEGAHDD